MLFVARVSPSVWEPRGFPGSTNLELAIPVAGPELEDPKIENDVLPEGKDESE